MAGTPNFQLQSSSSIVCTDGRTPQLADAYKLPIDNANLPNGFILLDENGVAIARVKPIADTAANWNAVVMPSGEFGYLGDIELLCFGDGVSYGGRPISLNSQSSIFVGAKGSAAQNAIALQDTIAAAAARTPYGSALSVTNQITVLVGPGSWDLTGLSGNLTIPNYVRLISLCGSSATIINTDGTHRLVVNQATSGDSYSTLKGFTFTSSTGGGANAAITVQMGVSAPNFLSLDWDDLVFSGYSSSQAVMGFGSMTSYSSPTLTGRVRNCRTVGTRFLGGQATNPSGATPLTFTVIFENCEAGDQSFGGGSGTISDTRNGLMGGGFYNCKLLGTGVWAATLNCPMVGCEWGLAGGSTAIQRLGSSAYIRQTVIRGIVSTYSLNHSGAVNVKLRSNTLAGAIHTNVTNILTGTPDGGGNLVGDTDA